MFVALHHASNLDIHPAEIAQRVREVARGLRGGEADHARSVAHIA